MARRRTSTNDNSEGDSNLELETNLDSEKTLESPAKTEPETTTKEVGEPKPEPNQTSLTDVNQQKPLAEETKPKPAKQESKREFTPAERTASVCVVCGDKKMTDSKGRPKCPANKAVCPYLH